MGHLGGGGSVSGSHSYLGASLSVGGIVVSLHDSNHNDLQNICRPFLRAVRFDYLLTRFPTRSVMLSFCFSLGEHFTTVHRIFIHYRSHILPRKVCTDSCKGESDWKAGSATPRCVDSF